MNASEDMQVRAPPRCPGRRLEGRAPLVVRRLADTPPGSVRCGNGVSSCAEKLRVPAVAKRAENRCSNGEQRRSGGDCLTRALLVLVRQLFLPSMKKKTALAESVSPDGDVLQDHWLVDDMFSFENIGFTKDVGNIKFLICADCEIGPIGWDCLDDKKSFYVALDRVSHE
ncbi:guanine nucleotide exchange factor MSS4 [Alligator sinensis]|uniref:Guanine nucleotide exchange factor MSS4 n=1 Tax=Alligator sinensis TaxID=38654 RepID=A0A1U8DY88_ALLSI|nr:guanine nucleotide exchange factor MSS4 [Alligator sinensis]